MNKVLHATIHGNVQGVFYRKGAQQEAQKLNLIGYVKNLPDGTVELKAEGPKENLQKLLNWCYNGPKHARIDRVDFKWLESTQKYSSFEITS